MRPNTKYRCASIASTVLIAGAGAFWAPQQIGGSGYGCGNIPRVERIIRARSADPRSGYSSRLNGVPEWRASQQGELRELGFLPFPVDDIMCPGETKALHLYEARFLALFEDAIRSHGGCVGGAFFIEDGVLVKAGQLCDIIAWEKEKVGVSVAIRCVGRVEIDDLIGDGPYIRASVREIQDIVGDYPDDEDTNGVVSSDLYSLHRQCVEIEGKMAAGSGSGRVKKSRAGSTESLVTRNRRDMNKRERSTRSRGDDTDDPDGLFEGVEGNGDGGGLGKRDSEAEELMAKFQRGGGELDMSELASSAGEGVEWGISGAEDEEEHEGVFVFDVDDGEEGDDEEVDNYDDEKTGGKDLEYLLWGHETRSGEGLDVSLEEQVESMHESLKADLSVSLDEPRRGLDASRFGAALGNDGRDGKGAGAKTIAELIAASGGALDLSREGEEEEFLWGCSSKEEEHDQLVSYVSLGWFDPSARLQALIIKSTGQRLRFARDFLAERLKVLVAKSALSQLGD